MDSSIFESGQNHYSTRGSSVKVQHRIANSVHIDETAVSLGSELFEKMFWSAWLNRLMCSCLLVFVI